MYSRIKKLIIISINLTVRLFLHIRHHGFSSAIKVIKNKRFTIWVRQDVTMMTHGWPQNGNNGPILWLHLECMFHFQLQVVEYGIL